eukprot:CAMPEP_0119409394 /NCGR_PEP_ID=MMETSP1335-20130426/2689_1 /TAXON_ID=259385 /ORGANISM="Chrysoculter rhomboideus, Strain RCC1486" /LENGTH=86 /DNA_ID=CAMNT_0007433763 /DNA_START=49 /DNA_END=309 /DNA_ORIENTATION=-
MPADPSSLSGKDKATYDEMVKYNAASKFDFPTSEESDIDRIARQSRNSKALQTQKDRFDAVERAIGAFAQGKNQGSGSVRFMPLVE